MYLGCTFCAYNDISFTYKKEFEHEMRIRWQGVAKAIEYAVAGRLVKGHLV